MKNCEMLRMAANKPLSSTMPHSRLGEGGKGEEEEERGGRVSRKGMK
jgi:hypothetical protein